MVSSSLFFFFFFIGKAFIIRHIFLSRCLSQRLFAFDLASRTLFVKRVGPKPLPGQGETPLTPNVYRSGVCLKSNYGVENVVT